MTFNIVLSILGKTTRALSNYILVNTLEMFMCSSGVKKGTVNSISIGFWSTQTYIFFFIIGGLKPETIFGWISLFFKISHTKRHAGLDRHGASK